MIVNEQETVSLCPAQGDAAAMQYLYCRHRTTLLRAVTRIVKDPDEAEDVLQDAFVKAWQHIDTHMTSRGSLFNWLLRIARNTAIDAVRRRRPSCSLMDPEALSVAGSDVPVESIDIRLVARQSLQPYQWQIIELVYWYGFTGREVADQLALPLGTIKTRIRQSLTVLRPYFDSTTQKRTD